MKPNSLTRPSKPLFAQLIILTIFVSQAAAADRYATYRNMTMVEEPLAMEMGDVTLSLRGTIEALSTLDLSSGNDDNSHADFVAEIETHVDTQLSNYWNLKGSYILNVDTRETDEIKHSGALTLRGHQGELSFGHVSNRMRDLSIRNLSAGNADLAFDHALAELDDLTVSQIFEEGPVRFGAVADFKGNFELGAIYQRPIANRDLRFSLRLTNGTFAAASGDIIDGIGGHGMTELVYSNWTLNLGSGYEYITAGNMDAQRYYLSSGLARKVGAVTLSVEGHYGQIAGTDEISAALGASYDVGRGASLNAGLNYKKADVNKDGVQILDDDETELIMSLRYSF